MTEATALPPVVSGLEVRGRLNMPDGAVADHVRASIRRGHPQVWRCQERPERVALVGSGPSLEATLPELRELVFAGAKLVTVNGAYAWCLARNLKPHAQVVVDARPSTARFLQQEVPGCRYYVASQCHPSAWDVVQGREFVGIFHALGDQDAEIRAALDAYYLGHWVGVMGGTTVATRALGVLRLLGFLRYDLFGVDCCWLGGAHHAVAQPENDHDTPFDVDLEPVGDPGQRRRFVASPWMLKQAMDVLEMIRAAGDHFLLSVHGDGLLAYMLRTSAAVVGAQPTTGEGT